MQADYQSVAAQPRSNTIQSYTSKNKVQTNQSSELWVDKYSPKRIADLVGNKANIGHLEKWLRGFDDVVLRNMPHPTEGGKNSSNINAKACLITGPPGIGKTSAVRLVSSSMGYHVLELNASDTRSKKSIEALLTDLSKSINIKGSF